MMTVFKPVFYEFCIETRELHMLAHAVLASKEGLAVTERAVTPIPFSF